MGDVNEMTVGMDLAPREEEKRRKRAITLSMVPSGGGGEGTDRQSQLKESLA